MSETNNSESNANEDELAQISPEMAQFFQRADAFIHLANSQLSPETHSGKVGSSLMYASARFSASLSAIGFANGEEFTKEKEQIIDFYTNQFKLMLSDNLDDYAQNFAKYTQTEAQ